MQDKKFSNDEQDDFQNAPSNHRGLHIKTQEVNDHPLQHIPRKAVFVSLQLPFQLKGLGFLVIVP